MTLSAGARLGPYEILSPLGAGGMGEVYRARDARLGREVALKILPEELAGDGERLSRFEQEARSASALNHPNIVTIYDVGREGGTSYIAMELVEGRSLREQLAAGPPPPARTLSIAVQIAEGLARAHTARIVHRDLKPENVMVTTDGLVKILDFGLAKLSPQPEQDGRSAVETAAAGVTSPGVVLGTTAYMSPEQATGGAIDFRSDQFSFGTILYEMVTGARPFQRASAIETLSAIVRDEPPPLAAVAPKAPERLRWVIERCLAKDPEERYASTRDLARDLTQLRDRGGESGRAARAPRSRSLRRTMLLVAAALLAALVGALLVLRGRTPPTPAAADRSLAILPFQNLGGRAEDQYFADGMTESLITDLAKVKHLLVIARNSVFKYRGSGVDVRDVGRQLGVRYVLEGSIQRSGDSLRINAQLVDAATGYHMWAERYDRPLADIFALQDEISRRITGSLEVALDPGDRSNADEPTRNLAAYDAYLRGTFYAHRTTEHEAEDNARAISLFERAVGLDPRFAQAHAALANAYTWKFFNADPDPNWEAKASAEVEKTLSLDPNLPEAYVARGNLAWTLARNFPHEAAVRDFRKALEINPNLAEARRFLGRVYMHLGLFEKALGEWNRALKVDPADTWVLLRMATLRLYECNYARALADFDRYPELVLDEYRAVTLDHLGRREEALAVVRKVLEKNPRDYEAASVLAIFLARGGDPRGAEEKIALATRLGQGRSHFHHQEYDFACAHAAMGKKKEAVEWLRRSAEHGFPCYPLFAKDSYLDPLRDDSEFQALLLRMKKQWDEWRATL